VSWLKPLDFVPPPAPVIRKTDGVRMPTTKRAVTINGVHYRSMMEARNKLGLRSYSQVYRLIGEQWRYGCRKAG
jgi:hypothetical protein